MPGSISYCALSNTDFIQDELDKSIKLGSWRTQPHNEAILGTLLLESFIRSAY